METRRRRRVAAAGAGLALAMPVGCVPWAPDAAAGPYDEVVVVLPDWAGGQANAGMAAYLLQTGLGATVELRELAQAPAWDALDAGDAHVILEDWGALPDKIDLYVGKHESVVPAGDLGPVGQVGWYVPEAYAAEHPEALSWRTLDEIAPELRTDASGGRGQLLYGHPEDASADEELIRELDLDLTAVPAGSEELLIESLRQAGLTGEPLLVHWWTPHWLAEEVPLAEVALPAHRPGCREAAAAPVCGYPRIPLRKYLNAEFAETGGRAADVLARFRWTTEEQNEVARLIGAEDMTPLGAATAWAEEHPERVESWLAR